MARALIVTKSSSNVPKVLTMALDFRKLKITIGSYKIVQFYKRRVPNKNEGGKDFSKINKAYPLVY